MEHTMMDALDTESRDIHATIFNVIQTITKEDRWDRAKIKFTFIV